MAQLPQGYEKQDGGCGKKTGSFVVERGTDGEARDGSDQREVKSLVPDQSNDVSRRLEPSRETAHCTDERCVEELRNLIVERGNGTERAVGKSAPP
jgi:hypothetical protein